MGAVSKNLQQPQYLFWTTKQIMTLPDDGFQLPWQWLSSGDTPSRWWLRITWGTVQSSKSLCSLEVMRSSNQLTLIHYYPSTECIQGQYLLILHLCASFKGAPCPPTYTGPCSSLHEHGKWNMGYIKSPPPCSLSQMSLCMTRDTQWYIMPLGTQLSGCFARHNLTPTKVFSLSLVHP